MKSEVFNMDCMEGMAQYPDKYFDFCITDPPYGVGLKYNTYDDTIENWYNLMNGFIPEITRICKMVIFPSCSINKLQWIYNNYPPDWLISWHKGSTGHAAFIGFNGWEPLLVYGKLKGVYFHDYLTLQNSESMGNYGHPCPKPLGFFKKFYKKIPHDSKIIDPFCGSGTSRIASDGFDFEYTGYELDKDYFEAQEKRFNQYKSQLVLF